MSTSDDAPVRQPKWALESDDPVVLLLLQAGTPVTRANYIRVAFFGEQGDDLDAEYEAGLPPELQK
jgi:hypothetical protein